MADHVPFVDGDISQANRISAAWLNDVNDFIYDNFPGQTVTTAFKQSGTGAVARTLLSKLREVVSVADFGAVGDGVTDDTAAIQAALDSMSSGTTGSGVIFFPRTSGTSYLITDTLHIGRFSVDVNNNVLGFAAVHYNLEIDLGGNTIQWGGSNQPGSSYTTKSPSFGGTYTLLSNAKPMFSVVAAIGFTMRQGILLCNTGGNKAYAGVWFQGNHRLHRMDNVRIYGGFYGVRHGCWYDVTGGLPGGTYYGYMGDPNFALGAAAVIAGGWQGDTQAYTACDFNGSVAHFSTESGQNLSIVMAAQLLGDQQTGTYGIINAGGRITALGLGIISGSTYDIHNPTGTMSLNLSEYHTENGPGIVSTSTNAAAPNITITNSDVKIININGGGANLTLANCSSVTITRADVNAVANISVQNSTIAAFTFMNTGVQRNLKVSIKGCTLSAAVLAAATASNCYLDLFNNYLQGNSPVYAQRWAATYESMDGNTHYFKNRLDNQASGAAAAIIGAIDTTSAGNSSAGSALLRLTIAATANGAACGACFGLYTVAWCKDSTGNITTAVGVVQETKALDAMATLVPTVAAAVSSAKVQITVTQTNANVSPASIDAYCEFIAGGFYGNVSQPVFSLT